MTGSRKNTGSHFVFMPSPRLTVAVSALFVAMLALLTLATALSLPWTGLSWQAQEHGLLISAVSRQSPNSAHVASGTVITHFAAGQQIIAADPVLLIEEPDILPSYQDYNLLMEHNRHLLAAAKQGELQAITDNGERVTVQVGKRPLRSLPGLFWLQLAFGVIGALTGVIVWSVRIGNLPASLYLLTGVGYLIFAPAAAVYSTRELLIDAELFRALSIINHFGALFFTASLTSLLWHYPTRLGRFPVALLCYTIALAAWLTDALQLTPSSSLFHLSVLGVFALSFIFAFFQWLRTRKKPAERAALRWFLLSIYLATSLFAGVIIVPAALGVTPPASQGVMFGAFLIMYIGLAFGVTRYRLFQLERWWLSIWAWFLSGVAIIAVDLLLVSFVAVSTPFALSIAVALVGWLYFPVRQKVWSFFARRRGDTMEDWLERAIPPLMSANQLEHLSDALTAAAQAVFDPLDITRSEDLIAAPTIADNGQRLLLPSPADHSTLRLHHANRGSRLFTSRDLDSAAFVLRIYHLIEDSLSAHEQGVRSERSRIRQDIHDDLGAKLLTLLHRADAHDQKLLVREAIRDLRDLLSSMDSIDLSLEEAALQWEQEARQRCNANSVTLDWQSFLLSPQVQIDQRRIADLTRIIREAVSNALRHAQPSVIKIKLSERDNSLAIAVENDGLNQRKDNIREGRGIGIIRQRVRRLGGVVGMDQRQGLWWINVRVPLFSDGFNAEQRNEALL